MAVFTGRRIYDNNVQGTLTDNPLTNVATTMNSAGLANLSAVSSNHAVIVLDPLRASGAPEIVIVTAHTGSATSATITRGAYGTSARQHASGTLWVHPVTKDDLIQVLTATPADVYEGQLWYRSDTDIYVAHNGSAAIEALPIGAWQDYVPVVTQSGTLTMTVDRAKFTRQGRKITVDVRLTYASGTGTAGQPVIISLPVTAARSTAIAGSGFLFDSSAPANHRAIMELRSTTTTHLAPTAITTSDVLGVVGFTAAVTTGDILGFGGTYEAAS